MKNSIALVFCFISISLFAQNSGFNSSNQKENNYNNQITKETIYKSIMQEQANEYSKYDFTKTQQWDSLFLDMNPGMTRKVLPLQKSNCTLNKVVYGWNPYWSGTTYLNYQWNLLTHLCHFSYEVDYVDGTANSTHSWATDDAVDAALANGVKVDLCVTLFSNHATFLANATAKQTLITNLINLVQSRGANGVNIDFEGLPSAQSINFTNFMIDLCTQMHTAIPGSQVSICLYSVDWSNVFDEPALNPYVDMFIIMGYDYYYGGSSTAGPNDPLYNFITSYNYTLTKTITYYLSNGITPSKLILGLPYYGKQWATIDNTVGSSTTASGTSPFYNTVRTNTSGNYSTKLWNTTSFTPYYAFQVTGQWYQCWIDDAYSLGERFDMVNQRGIGGIGIWALGYDDGYTELWEKIQDKFSSCATVQCSDTIYDMGGPSRNYYNNENYTYTIAPDGASSLTLTFSTFSVSDDTLWIYDGSSTASPLIGSYTSTNNPGVINASGNTLTLKFRSRTANISTGWSAIWQCQIDNISPTTLITTPQPWITSDFTATFTDTDNINGSGIEKSFYNVSDFDDSTWTSNTTKGFFRDDFQEMQPNWTSAVGTWAQSSGELSQTDESIVNTNIYASLNQNLSDRYLYQFKAQVSGTGTNKRFGFHFFCDNASLTNRGNSYFIWFRVDDQSLQFYKVVNDTSILESTISGITTNTGQVYDIKVTYDRITGKISVWRDNIFLGNWIDSAPYFSNGDYISFRTGNCAITVDDFISFRSRYSTANIITGNISADIRNQNPDPLTPAAQIKSIVIDGNQNFSSVITNNLNIDWTPPADISFINDGLSNDVDTLYQNNQLSASWGISNDTHSGIAEYWYTVGTTPGDSNIISWTNNSTNMNFTLTGLTLNFGTSYFISVKVKNGAGLFSQKTISDGAIILSPGALPYIAFAASDTVICTGETVDLINNTVFADSYSWIFTGASPGSSTDQNPVIYYTSPGIYDITLIATNINGTDTTIKTDYITVNESPVASFNTNVISGQPPLPVIFNNQSTGANSYVWNFGDGHNSTEVSPFNIYTTSGIYTVSLIASNELCYSDTVFCTIWVGGSTISSNSSDQLTLYPNPANDYIYIDWKNKNSIHLEMYDNLGKKCLISYTLSGRNHAEIDASSLESGFYYLLVTSKNTPNEMIKIAIFH